MIKVKTVIAAIGLGLMLVSCGEETQTDPALNTLNEEALKVVKASLSVEQTQSILGAYLKIKNALVETEKEQASEAAKELSESLSVVANPTLASLQKNVKGIENAKDIEEQRVYFYDLSNAMYQIIKATSSQQAIFLQHCPMARDDKGAYWLNEEPLVSNPYYGDKMLRCGSMKEQL